MAEFELTEERIKSLRVYVGILYRDKFCLRHEPFEDIYQTALLHIVETQSDEGVGSWLVWSHMKYKEFYNYNYPTLFSQLKPEENTKGFDNFIDSLAPVYDPYDEDPEDDHKVIYDLSEKLYDKREDLREGFMHYCFGEDTDLLDINRRMNIRRKVFKMRFFILKELYNSGFLSFEVYTKYLKLANELQELPKLAKHLLMTSECISNRKSRAKNIDKVLTRKREYYKRKKQARLNSAKEQQQ